MTTTRPHYGLLNLPSPSEQFARDLRRQHAEALRRFYAPLKAEMVKLHKPLRRSGCIRI